MNPAEHIHRNRTRYYIVLICAIALVLSTRGITDEGNITMNGDMQKYLMNGAFFYDFISDMTFTDPLGYAYKYFARYPALTLGHHPILLGVAEMPFYAVFGISIFSAKLTVVFFMLLGAVAWFFLVRSVYDETTAFLSSLLFITTPYIVEFSRLVMTEIPTTALIIVTIYFFYRYCETDDKKYIYASAVIISLSMYSKHTAVFLFPLLLCYFLIRKGFRNLLRREVLISCLITGLLLLPLVFITVKFSHYNFDMGMRWVKNTLLLKKETKPDASPVRSLSSKNRTASDMTPAGSPLLKNKEARHVRPNKFLYYINALWKYHITIPVLVLSMISIIVSVYKRDRKMIIFFLWLAVFYLLVTHVGWKLPRYGIFWIPVYCLFAAATVNFSQSRRWKICISTVLILIAGYQFAVSFLTGTAYANGYEEAARYIVENKKGESVLYSSRYDTGYFIFFTRKHNPDHDLIVLRANKILATSKMSRIINNRIGKSEDIYDILKKYGVRYVVVGSKGYKAKSIMWLEKEVQTDKFILRKEIILKSDDKRIDNKPLSIYEYKEYSPPDENGIVDMQIPLMGNSIKVLFKDLISKHK